MPAAVGERLQSLCASIRGLGNTLKNLSGTMAFADLNDAYLGGERSEGKTGRASEIKALFVVAVQTTASGLIDWVCMAQVSLPAPGDPGLCPGPYRPAT